MTESKSFPTHVDLMWPTLQALKKLGGSGNNEEIYDKIIEIKKGIIYLTSQLQFQPNFH